MHYPPATPNLPSRAERSTQPLSSFSKLASANGGSNWS